MQIQITMHTPEPDIWEQKIIQDSTSSLLSLGWRISRLIPLILAQGLLCILNYEIHIPVQYCCVHLSHICAWIIIVSSPSCLFYMIEPWLLMMCEIHVDGPRASGITKLNGKATRKSENHVWLKTTDQDLAWLFPTVDSATNFVFIDDFRWINVTRRIIRIAQLTSPHSSTHNNKIIHYKQCLPPRLCRNYSVDLWFVDIIYLLSEGKNPS